MPINKYRIPGNFRVAKFLQFHEFLLSRKIKFREIIAMPHLLYCTRGSFTEIFFVNFYFAKISRYTVHCYIYSLEQSLSLSLSFSLSLSLSLSLLCFFFLIKHCDGCQATIVCVVPYVPILFSDGLVLW